MKKSESIKQLMTSLGKLQSECIKVTKDSTNPHFKSKYASLSAILNIIQPVLTKHNFAYTQLPEAGKLTTLLMHTESGEWIETEYDLNSIQQTPQAIGSAITYARRYSLTATLGLNIDDDDDGNAATHKAPQQANKQAQAQPQQTPFNKQYTDKQTILAVLETAKAAAEVTTLYNANKGLIDADQGMKDALKKKQTQIKNGGKLIINDEQFNKVLGRLNNGELDVYNQALNVYILADNQKAKLEEAYAHQQKLEQFLAKKHEKPETIKNIADACTCAEQVKRLHKTNSFIIDRDEQLKGYIVERTKALTPAA